MNTIITDYGLVGFKPLHDRLMVKRLHKLMYVGSIAIPESAQENSDRAEVVAVGQKVKDVKEGDIVLVPGAGNKYPDWENFDYIIIQQADIAGTLTY